MAARARVRYSTIFVFPSTARGKGVRVNAAPETLTVRAGDVVDWTVVNAASDAPCKVSIKWKDKNPLKGEPKEFDRAARATVRADVKAGRRYRYSIVIDGVEVFDPEIEIMS